VAQNLTSSGLVKHFAGVTALSDGNLIAKSGEVVALMGANGSGKSTLCKIVTGVVAPDGGQLRLNGSTISFSSPQEALIWHCGSVSGIKPYPIIVYIKKHLADS